MVEWSSMKIYVPRKIYVAKSNIHGLGVFAKKDLKKGEVVFILKGNLKEWEVHDSESSATGPNWIGIDRGLWIDPRYPANFLNHSCNPTMGIKGKLSFVALKNIKKDVELTFDYSITEDDLLWHITNTNSQKKQPRFRKIIKSVQYLPYDVYRSYLPYVPKHFQKVYNEYHKLNTHGHKI